MYLLEASVAGHRCELLTDIVRNVGSAAACFVFEALPFLKFKEAEFAKINIVTNIGGKLHRLGSAMTFCLDCRLKSLAFGCMIRLEIVAIVIVVNTSCKVLTAIERDWLLEEEEVIGGRTYSKSGGEARRQTDCRSRRLDHQPRGLALGG